MTDLELTRLCAEAMGYEDVHIAHGCMGTAYVKFGGRSITHMGEFRPLHDDAQMAALVKQCRLDVDAPLNDGGYWSVRRRETRTNGDPFTSLDKDLNRAVVECVAKMWKRVKSEPNPSVQPRGAS
mgnify:FL=1